MKTTKNKSVYEYDITNTKASANSIVFPDSIEEVKNIVNLSKFDIIPRGSGTSFTGACVPNNSIVVDMSKMNKILSIDPARKTVHVQAGVILDDLNQELEKYNLEIPISTPFSKIRTIGGIIATNSSGSRELKYGRIRNFVDSLEIVNAKGELKELPKTESTDFVGLEGTTGIIMTAKLRLTTKKKRSFSILKSETLEGVLELTKKFKLDHEVCSIELIGKVLSVMSGLENKYHLFVEYESNKGTMSGQMYEKFFNLKSNSYYTMASHGFFILENPKFYIDDLSHFIIFLENNKIPYYSNLGSGSIYVCFNPREKLKYEQAMSLIKKLRARHSYELGTGLTKKEFLDENEKQLITRIKLRHDPENRFNAGKVIDIKIPIIPKKQEKLKPQENKEPEKREFLDELKTPEEKLEEFIQEQEKIEQQVQSQENYKQNLEVKKLDNNIVKAIEENKKIEKPKPTKEEQDMIKKIAGGYI